MRNALFGACALGAIGLAVLSGCSQKGELSHLEGENFNSQVWRVSVHSRSVMLADLMKKHRLLGMTAEEVTSLLGRSDAYFENDKFPAYHLNSSDSCILAMPIDKKSDRVLQIVVSPAGCL
ncbi:hypothetical protein ACKC9G_14810 [Pokkaliibacter sp. CJK22405]